MAEKLRRPLAIIEPDDAGNSAKRAEMAEAGSKGAERALVAEIGTVKNTAELKAVITKVEAFEEGEVKESLKAEVNRKHLQLLRETQLSNVRSEEKSVGESGVDYVFGISSLRGLYDLMHMNPFMAGEDKAQYEALWRQTLEPQAIEIFTRSGKTAQLQPGFTNSIDYLIKTVTVFPFTSEETRKEVLENLDEVAARLFGDVGRKAQLRSGFTNSIDYLIKTVTVFPFTSEETRKEVLAILRENQEQLQAKAA